MPIQTNKSLRILFLLNSIFVFAGSLFGPLYAVYVQGIDNRIISVSVSWAVFMIASTVFMYFVGKYGDKIHEKEYLLAGGFLVRAVAWFGYIYVTNITSLLIIQIILGLGQALGTPAWNVLFAKHLDGNREIMDYSSWDIISNLVTALATVIGGLMVTALGFKPLFLIMGYLALVSFVGTLIIPRKVL